MKIHTIDLQFQEIEKAIAIFPVEGPDGAAILFETGPESCRERSLAGLRAAGFSPKDIEAVFVTHIHLDHAGAAGWWASQGVPVYVHPRGAKHLIDPTKLVASARMVYGDQFDALWGEMIPAPEDMIRVIKDAETVEAAGLEITAMDTPGHAFHHHCFALGGIAFAGDAAGVRLPGNDYTSVASAPPQFHLEYLIESINKMREAEFASLYLTHFGEISDPDEHLADYERAVRLNAQFVRDRLNEGMDAASLRVAYQAFQMEQAFRHDLPSTVWETFQTANPAGMCADGIRLYWEKEEVRSKT